MKLHNVAHTVYLLGRKALTATGLFKPLRKLIGPQAGRFISRAAADVGRPSQVHGHQMFLATGDSYPPVAMATDRYERETTELFEELVKPGMVVVDVGAHVGYYSLLAARNTGPQGKVYSFEPEPRNHSLLLKNIGINGYTNIVPFRKAVSNRVGETTLFLTALDSGRHSTYHHDLPEKGSVTVETTTIDASLAAEGWPEVDLIKVDVEGAEMDVLKGMSQLLEKSLNVSLIIEFNPVLLDGAGAGRSRLVDQLAGLGFEIHPIIENRGPVPLSVLDWNPMVAKLLATEGSLNLFCIRNNTGASHRDG